MLEKEYKKNKHYWGLKSSPTLEKYINEIPKGKALDIGAGEGRNSIFLAKNEFDVTAIDKIKQGLDKIKKLAKKYDLTIKTELCDIKNLKLKKEEYSLIISVSTIDFLKKNEINTILDKIKNSLKLNGFIYLSVFSIKDPLLKLIKEKKLKEIEKNTFYLPKFKIYRHFFTKTEIKEKFKDFNIILLKQKEILDTGHDKPHYHNIIEFLAQKK
ncbi:methyltransferase domain-containing protein [Patescibacteria group bacterium]|nr:methyltransferase domain-containing protein [Patescibacteria group bacterium]